MSANTNNATGSFISYPEVKVSEIEFGITLRSYKIRIKLGSNSNESNNVSFTPTFSNSGSSFITSVRQSVEMPCYLPPHYFIFYAQMEKENPLIEQDASSQQNEICVLYMKVKELPEDVFLLMKHSVNVVCGCGHQEEWKNPMSLKENFLDCGNQPMTAISSSSPLIISKHQHDYSAHGLHQEYFVFIRTFDFSKASVVPFEAQRLMARKKCSLQLRNHVITEWVKPFDVTIKCKGGYSIGAHKTILSVRSRVFKVMLESDFQEAKTNTIHVMDLNAPVMKIILHFIYTGELDPEWVKVPIDEVIYGADKYELPELLGFFDHLMIAGCNFHNALRLAQLAERHSLMNARNCILGFIETHLAAVFNESVSLTVRRM